MPGGRRARSRWTAVFRARPQAEDANRGLIRFDARSRFLRRADTGRALHPPRGPASRRQHASPARSDVQGFRSGAGQRIAARSTPPRGPELERPHRMIAMVDYGVGNLASLYAALRRAGAEDVRITRSHVDILAANAVVLPGVGRFGHCASELRRLGLDVMLRAAHDRGIPLPGARATPERRRACTAYRMEPGADRAPASVARGRSRRGVLLLRAFVLRR